MSLVGSKNPQLPVGALEAAGPDKRKIKAGGPLSEPVHESDDNLT